jgi:hypothetical protein
MLTAITAAVLYAAMAADPAPAAAQAAAPVRHVALFKFKEGTTPEQVKSVEEGLQQLPKKIDAIKSFEWGTNNSPEKLNDGYTLALYATFADAAGRDAYLPHPAHKEFGQLLKPYRDAVTVFDYVPQVVMPAPALKNPVRHIVMFKFKDGTTPEQVKAIEDAFAALPSKIDVIKGFEWGTDISPEKKADGLTHCFVLTFANEADRDAYLPHPAHKEFGKILGPQLDKVRVFDFTAQK